MLVGNRIVLRNISEKDFNLFFQFHNSQFVLKYNCMHLMSEQDVKDYIVKYKQDDSVIVIASLEKDELLGMIFVHEDSIRYLVNSIEVSYWIGECFSHQGYMFEALSLLFNELFQTFDSITARAFQENKASIHLLTKLGFVCEGTLKQAVLGYNNKIFDDCIFSLRKEMWNKE